MPPSRRHRARLPPDPSPQQPLSDSDDDFAEDAGAQDEEMLGEGMVAMEGDEVEEDEDDEEALGECFRFCLLRALLFIWFC